MICSRGIPALMVMIQNFTIGQSGIPFHVLSQIHIEEVRGRKGVEYCKQALTLWIMDFEIQGRAAVGIALPGIPGLVQGSRYR